ncbi:hypothetical protein BO86DRAFT_30775 [Aspergillus japonicus CBS 114.51]|uniref:Uncharacterized protein n=1 Tax=Aspergillus japonicus CBS 114.51 TaxID=1448312 RepID=A0A8T8WJR6_ASPJA|nr:hypothetical protein BO86DRAFT_30775 [Aspergillus japonicus CBS 114.51]RAH76065.1 hypothetical protein BO86DRAFT_30775 [Aspergillus japonicus CBS 114.51]
MRLPGRAGCSAIDAPHHGTRTPLCPGITEQSHPCTEDHRGFYFLFLHPTCSSVAPLSRVHILRIPSQSVDNGLCSIPVILSKPLGKGSVRMLAGSPQGGGGGGLSRQVNPLPCPRKICLRCRWRDWWSALSCDAWCSPVLIGPKAKLLNMNPPPSTSNPSPMLSG